MTETEIIKYIKTHSMKEVFDNIPDDAYTSKIVETLNEDLLSCLYLIAKNSDLRGLPKEVAIKSLKDEPAILGKPQYNNYSVFPSNLQSDPDIIRIVTSDIEHLPKDFYKNKECMKYLLNKYNEGNSRSAFSDYGILIIAPDISKPYHSRTNPIVAYFYDTNISDFQQNSLSIADMEEIDFTQPFETVAPKICCCLRDHWGNGSRGGKYITKIED